MTIAGSDGKPVVIPPALVAQAQLGQLKPGPDGTVTVQGSDGKPVKIPATTLAATAAASVVPAGRQHCSKLKINLSPRIDSCTQMVGFKRYSHTIETKASESLKQKIKTINFEGFFQSLSYTVLTEINHSISYSNRHIR